MPLPLTAELLADFAQPVSFVRDQVRTAPDASGVHVVLDAEGSVIYVGETGDLRRRLHQHLTGGRQASVLHEQVGALLDKGGPPASPEDIAAWLGRCTVRWKATEAPAALKEELVQALTPRFNRSGLRERPNVWWVNQGRSYEPEQAAGIIFAGTEGSRIAHHLDVGRLAPGDEIIHYRQGHVVALGEVVAQPTETRRPYGPVGERDFGWLARVEYFPLATPLVLAELPPRNGDEGPFMKNGGVKQGYLFPLASDFADRLRASGVAWPAGSPWAPSRRRYWLFQASPKQWDLRAHLPQMPPGHVEDWTVTRHRTEMQVGDAVALWQGGEVAGIYAVGRLVGRPQLRPRPAFRPNEAGDEEHRVDVVIERHAVPPISRDFAQTHEVLADLEVLRRPWSGTNLPLTREQWWSIRSLLPLEASTSEPAHWQELLHWAKRFADSMDLDAIERNYKLHLRDRVVAARTALESGSDDWVRLLRKAFAPPNNLTSFYQHGKLLGWCESNPTEARAALLALWDDSEDIGAAITRFCAALPGGVSGSGVQANIASYLAAARGVEDHPPFRITTFERAYRLADWPHEASQGPAALYGAALDFLDVFATACRAHGVAPMRDRLDAQGLLWCILDGQPAPSWSDAEVAAYRSFLEGKAVDELASLVNEFRTTEGYPAGGRPERYREREELSVALTLEGLEEPDVRLLRRLAGPAYGSPGSQPGFNRLLQSSEGVERLCAALRFLLYGPGTVEQRLEDCISGEHKLPGVAEAMMMKALAVHDPQRWIPCYVTKGKVGKQVILSLLGKAVVLAPSQGDAAVASNDQIRALLAPHFPADPWGMQEFTWWLLHREHVPEAPLKELAERLYLTEEFLERVLRLLDDKGQIVFYGPPGTGKTYLAREVAGYVARGGGSVEKVQFHPSYAYEDFVEGYRPRLVDGQVTYEVVPGPLKRIAETAQERPDVTHVLLIDELNRGNVAKVLGELLFLLEYREEEIRLQYSDEPFSLPRNLRIIATMNTADRSIALVDTALRRRFHFVPFFPDTPPIDTLLRRWLAHKCPEFGWLADVLERANKTLADRNLAIGPSHFLRENLDESLVELIWQSSVLPFLEEHFFADPERLAEFALAKLKQQDAIPATSSDVATVETSSGE